MGLVPFWARDAKVAYSTINMKAEAIATAACALRLLFVDDDPRIRISLIDILRLRGFAVIAVDTVPEALELITSQKFDILLSDLNVGEPGDLVGNALECGVEVRVPGQNESERVGLNSSHGTHHSEAVVILTAPSRRGAERLWAFTDDRHSARHAAGDQ